MTNREKYLEILKEHGIYDEEVEEILRAVSDMLNDEADRLEVKEPYAFSSINGARKAAEEVLSLTYGLED